MKIPEFPPHLDWFNTSPLSVSRDLLGRVVVIDFWTFCCINCMHVLPNLAQLEAKYRGQPVLFIGVHSPKFAHEKSSEAVRHAIARLNVQHPVVSDPTMAIWRQLGVRAWPTIAIIGPDGRVRAMLEGESKQEEIDEWISQLLKEASKAPLEPFNLSQELKTALRFPGKVALDTAEEHLIISDTGHNRVVITNLVGAVTESIGSGQRGYADGSFSSCSFRSPQGVAQKAQRLYIADTENHTIRIADLAHRTVKTMIGTGHQGSDYRGGQPSPNQPLSSPWDLLLVGQCMYIAMAGCHQIWVYDFQTDRCTAYSGTGAELHLNSSHARRSCWAQPSGLALGMGLIFVADSESSAIRQINPTDGSTRTIVGGDPLEPRNLFAYGDRDGIGSEARLQHPLSVCWWDQRQRIIVADTYNHKLKLIDPLSQRIESWIGSGRAELADGRGSDCSFSEPSGLALSRDGRTLYVADTNNHAIRMIDTERAEVHTLQCKERTMAQ
jgi:thiol-disulfide isomerase/thioredoxin